MLNDLLKYISSKDFVSAKAVMESLLKEKIAASLEEKKLSVVDEMFNTKELTLEDYSLEELEAFVESEEYAQLDELSKSTLGSYIKKAGQHRVRLTNKERDLEDKANAISTAKHGSDDDTYKALSQAQKNVDDQKWKVRDKSDKRAEGIGRAVKRLTKESVEIDEAVKVSSSSKQNYEWSNGKKPSGHGRWMFSTIEPRKHDVRNDEHMKHTYTSSFASFSDASKEAAKHFKAAGHVGEIHVLS